MPRRIVYRLVGSRAIEASAVDAARLSLRQLVYLASAFAWTHAMLPRMGIASLLRRIQDIDARNNKPTDPEWFAYYIMAIEAQTYSSYQPAVLHEKIDTWTAQIEQSVLEDVNKPYPNTTYYNKVEELHEYVQQRYEFLDQWLACWQMGGTPDAEGYCVAP